MRCFCLPMLLLAAMVTSASTAGAAEAAEAAEANSSPAGATQLRDLVRTGVAAYRKKDFSTARTALLAAIQLKPELSFVAMLADTEMRLSRFRDAAEHWTFYLTLLSEDQEKERVEANHHIATCLNHVGTVTIEVVPDTAAVLLDGGQVEYGPSRRELWVDAGTHTIQARQGAESSPVRTVTVRAGERVAVNLVVAPPILDVPTSLSTAAAASGTAPSSTATVTPVPERASSARTYVLIGGATLAAVAAGIGTAYWGANRNAQKDEDAAWSSIDRLTDNPSVCASATPPVACSELQSARDRMKRTADISDISFIAAGVLSVATVGVYFLWPSREKTVQRGGLLVSPFWSSTNHGLAARIKF